MTDTDREQQLERLETAIEEAHEKVVNGRVRDPENERVRIKWIRALADVSAEYRKVLEDKDLDELRDRLDVLEGDGSDYRVK
jgi:hypothetical protein